MKIGNRAALIVIDIQNNFFPGGSAPAPDAEELIPILNRTFQLFTTLGAPIVVVRGWRPP